jgi:archaeosine-15-forming tRNA-guanine transglycosylase
MPGLASGWFRLKNGGKALCILTKRERVTVLRADDGTWLLLSLADATPLKNAIAT